MGLIWLRDENKDYEYRTPLTPSIALEIINYGHKIIIEKSRKRVFSDIDYKSNGCTLVESGTWVSAPKHCLILGLKHLPNDDFPLVHNHCYFSHAYNKTRILSEKDNSYKLIKRFMLGGGIHFDLEFLEDKNGNRIAAFGYHAGIVGGIVGMLVWSNILRDKPNESLLNFFSNIQELNQRIVSLKIDKLFKKLKILILGHKGRCGAGVCSFLKSHNINYSCWGRKETEVLGDFQKIGKFDIIFNCIRADENTQKIIEIKHFLNRLNPTLIVDIGCETSSNNPLGNIYKGTTSFDNPVHIVELNNSTLNIIAIDNLPSYLPLESSISFSKELFPHLVSYLSGQLTTPWLTSKSTFEQALSFF